MSSILEVALANSGNEVLTAPDVPEMKGELRSACIVIPVWNKLAETELLTFKALQSLETHVNRRKIVPHVVVVDNDSPVKTDWRSVGFDVDVVSLKKNRGFGPAVNLGATLYPESDYVVQMNSDSELVEDSVNILIDVMDKFDLAVGMPEHYENCKFYSIDKSDELMTDWRFGAFWIMRRFWWDLVDGFDEEFKFCYFEDSDLWLRIEKEGGRVRGHRSTWVKHVGGASSLPNRDELFEANRKLFEDRWKNKRG